MHKDLKWYGLLLLYYDFPIENKMARYKDVNMSYAQ